jgi:hypothetical protein
LPGTCRKVRVDPGTPEYAFIAARFNATFRGGGVLVQVERVENPGQLGAFEARARAVLALCHPRSRPVRWLFHGTTADAARRITTDPVVGFRATMARRMAAGGGLYFASDARTSLAYAPDGVMILAAVAVGRSAAPLGRGDRNPPPCCQSFSDGGSVFVIQVPCRLLNLAHIFPTSF